MRVSFSACSLLVMSVSASEAVEIAENMAECGRQEERGHLLEGGSEGALREGDLAAVSVGLEGYHLGH
jgi:hypothetical protein